MLSLGAGAADAVRRDLARELHDSVAQTLSAMLVAMENFKAAQYGRQGVIQEIVAYQEDTRDVLNNLRAILFGLRGYEGTTEEFVPRLQSRLTDFDRSAGVRTSMSVSPDWPQRLSTYAASQLTGIVDEALHNVRRHSGATEAVVRLGRDRSARAVVSIRDNGTGISPGREGAGLGITGMNERALLLGGELAIVPVSPKGTLVRASFVEGRLM
ncbi:MAG TPA: histidine kinase [Candidatus Dormibacteraeota bacterium]